MQLTNGRRIFRSTCVRPKILSQMNAEAYEVVENSPEQFEKERKAELGGLVTNGTSKVVQKCEIENATHVFGR